jgi:ankyrin repeat protein
MKKRNGKTPLEVSAEKGHKAVIALLEQRPAGQDPKE